MIVSTIQNFIAEFKGVNAFLKLSAEKKKITFYAEDIASKNYFGDLIDILMQKHQHDVCYLTSCKDDPLLTLKNPKFACFYVGYGVLRTYLFMRLNCKLLIMTMPDLETYHIKRSKLAEVKYIHVFHSIVSTHMVYRHKAFDHFDILFTVGPHQEREIRKTESIYSLPKKTIFEFGYPRIDHLLNTVKDTRLENAKPHILLAPSWGANGILECYASKICRIILDANYKLTVRPHPQTMYFDPKMAQYLREEFVNYPDFSFEDSIVAHNSLEESDLLISDWSGVAFEYAFVYRKPIVYIDMPRKVNNPHYEAIEMEPLESSIRSKLGKILSPDRLEQLPSVLEELLGKSDSIRSQNQKLLSETVFNIGTSSLVGAAEISRLANAE